jgi:hypothetical protein
MIYDLKTFIFKFDEENATQRLTANLQGRRCQRELLPHLLSKLELAVVVEQPLFLFSKNPRLPHHQFLAALNQTFDNTW